MTSDDEQQRIKYELRTLQSYLRNIVPQTPLPPDNIILSSNSLAIQSAISGLENQLLKLERDEKLRRKFASKNDENSGGGNTNIYANGANSVTMASKSMNEEDMDGEYVKMTKEDAAAAASTTMPAAAATATIKVVDDDDTKMDDDWEEADKTKPIEDQRDEFRSLASATIARIASSKIQVATPLGALGLALHIALLLHGSAGSASSNSSGDINDNELRCTGVPPTDDGKNSGGFAPPVRELPPGVLVPDSWEDCALSMKANDVDGKEYVAQTIAFRYWRGGGGGNGQGNGMLGGGAPTTVYLTLRLMSSSTPEDIMDVVHVTFGRQSAQAQMTIKLGLYINLDGFRTAKKTSTTTKISPSLFYISLSELLSQFDVTFGRALSPNAVKPPESNTAQMLETSHPVLPTSADPTANYDDGAAHRTMPCNPPLDHTLPDSVHGGDTMQSRKRGDFEGDLLPGGPLRPPLGMEDNTTIPPGSQVGPDHPIFDRTFGEDACYDYDDNEYRYGGALGGRDGFGLPGLPGGMGMRPR